MVFDEMMVSRVREHDAVSRVSFYLLLEAKQSIFADIKEIIACFSNPDISTISAYNSVVNFCSHLFPVNIWLFCNIPCHMNQG